MRLGEVRKKCGLKRLQKNYRMKKLTYVNRQHTYCHAHLNTQSSVLPSKNNGKSKIMLEYAGKADDDKAHSDESCKEF